MLSTLLRTLSLSIRVISSAASLRTRSYDERHLGSDRGSE